MKKYKNPKPERLTDESVFFARRRFVKSLGLGIAGSVGVVAAGRHWLKTPLNLRPRIKTFAESKVFANGGRRLTDQEDFLRFNNFYEFAQDKTSVIRKSKDFQIDPYSLVIDGLVDQPIKIDIEDIERKSVEERIYRFRCVETWAMTVPWIGVPLNELLKMVRIQPNARYVEMISFSDQTQAPRQGTSAYPWPYTEGLTIEEAMNPLSFVAIGAYGRYLHPQNGAPLRIVLPWKYGFKGPKSVVRITLTASRPRTFWNEIQPSEYGFFGNVDPDVPHPRWSQRNETLLGTWGKQQKTQKYNGYGEWVADLYDGTEV